MMLRGPCSITMWSLGPLIKLLHLTHWEWKQAGATGQLCCLPPHKEPIQLYWGWEEKKTGPSAPWSPNTHIWYTDTGFFYSGQDLVETFKRKALVPTNSPDYNQFLLLKIHAEGLCMTHVVLHSGAEGPVWLTDHCAGLCFYSLYNLAQLCR